MTERAELTEEEFAWLLAHARSVGQSAPGDLGMPQPICRSLLAKGCVSLGAQLQLTPEGLSIVAGAPRDAQPRAPVFLVAVDLSQRARLEGDDVADVPGTEPA